MCFDFPNRLFPISLCLEIVFFETKNRTLWGELGGGNTTAGAVRRSCSVREIIIPVVDLRGERKHTRSCSSRTRRTSLWLAPSCGGGELG